MFPVEIRKSEVEFAIAVIRGVGIVIGHTFPAEVIIGALQRAGNLLWPRAIHRVLEGLALVTLRQARVAPHHKRQAGDSNEGTTNR